MIATQIPVVYQDQKPVLVVLHALADQRPAPVVPKRNK